MRIVIIVFCVLVILIFLEIKRELNTFRKVQYDIKIEGLKKERKVIFLSDLHSHVYGKDNYRLINAINKESPDFILIGGDMLVGKKKAKYYNALQFGKKITAICPVYYANGNHEQRMKEFPENYRSSYAEYKRQLVEAGVNFLENDFAIVDWDNRMIKITGVEIPLSCYLHRHSNELNEDVLVERIGKRQEEYYEILLAHNPSYMKQYLERGADLILSGHLHGGIVRIPGIVGAISPNFELFPKYSGDHYWEGNTDIVVSKGLGTHTINIRLFNPAEIVVLNFSGDKLV